MLQWLPLQKFLHMFQRAARIIAIHIIHKRYCHTHKFKSSSIWRWLKLFQKINSNTDCAALQYLCMVRNNSVKDLFINFNKKLTFGDRIYKWSQKVNSHRTNCTELLTDGNTTTLLHLYLFLVRICFIWDPVWIYL